VVRVRNNNNNNNNNNIIGSTTRDRRTHTHTRSRRIIIIVVDTRARFACVRASTVSPRAAPSFLSTRTQSRNYRRRRRVIPRVRKRKRVLKIRHRPSPQSVDREKLRGKNRTCTPYVRGGTLFPESRTPLALFATSLRSRRHFYPAAYCFSRRAHVPRSTGRSTYIYNV
jgi:hypothetical protein